MSKTIFELKKDAKNGAALKKLREKIYIEKMTEGDDLFLARAHKLTRLKKIGRADTKTLLQPEVAEAMSVRVKRDAMKIIEKTGIDSGGIRFVTLLHEVVEMNRAVVQKSVAAMLEKIDDLFLFKRIFVFGAVELEIVNIEFVRDVAKKSEKQKRKLEVLEAMTESGDKFLESGARVMVHAHLIALSEDGDKEFFDLLIAKAKELWTTKHAVQFKALFEKNELKINIQNLSSYITKCGNETFRLKAAQARDVIIADEIAARPGEKDVRSLTKSQLLFLDDVYSDLQNRVAGARCGAGGAGRGHEIRKIQYGIR